MAAILNLEVKIITNLKKYNFIGFVIAKIVELDTLCIFMACLVPELSKLKFFKMAIGSHCVMSIRK